MEEKRNQQTARILRELKAQLAALKGVRSGQIFLGNGSDEAIDLAFRRNRPQSEIRSGSAS